MTLDPSKARVPAESTDLFDIRLVLVNLAATLSKGDPRSGLEELSREDPGRPEAWSALAYLALRDRDTKRALEYFSKAYSLGDRSPKLLWDYGRLAERERPQDSMRVLGDLVRIEPDNLDARIELASMQMNARLAREALATVKPIRQLDPERGQRLFSVMAAAQIQLGQLAEARASVTRLQSIASSQQFKDYAAELLRYLDQVERPAQPAQRSAVPQGAARAEVQGRIVAMECDEVPRMIVETNQGRKTFVVEPKRFVVTGKEPTAQGVACGPQRTPIPIRLRYEPVPAGVRGDGVVREVHFQ